MKYLFPHRFRKIGWLIFIPSFILGFACIAFNLKPEFLDFKVPAVWASKFLTSYERDFFILVRNNILNEIMGICLIISSLFIAFAKEKVEDEFIAKIRLDSLVWAVYVNYAILILSMLFVYDTSFFWVLVMNMFTVLWFFIVRYQIQLRKLTQSAAHEE